MVCIKPNNVAVRKCLRRGVRGTLNEIFNFQFDDIKHIKKPNLLVHLCIRMSPSCCVRFIRFNVQQAILVDILTVVLGLLGTAAGYVMPEGEQFMTNFAFYCLVGAVAYAVAETARGRKANQVTRRANVPGDVHALAVWN